MRTAAAAIALVLGGCDALAPLVEVQGPCSLTLTEFQLQLTPPYRAEMSMPGPGLPASTVIVDGGGWTGQVSITEIQPGGEVLESSLDAVSFNAGDIRLGFEEPGTFHYVFDDGFCRQEFDIESEAPPA